MCGGIQLSRGRFSIKKHGSRTFGNHIRAAWANALVLRCNCLLPIHKHGPHTRNHHIPTHVDARPRLHRRGTLVHIAYSGCGVCWHGFEGFWGFLNRVVEPYLTAINLHFPGRFEGNVTCAAELNP
jgi:hypothetical protein